MKRPEDMTEEEFAQACKDDPLFERDECRRVFKVMHGHDTSMVGKLKIADRSAALADMEQTATKLKAQATVSCGLLGLDYNEKTMMLYRLGYVQGTTDEFMHVTQAYQKATSAPIFKD